MSTSNLFEEFRKVNKVEWLDKVITDRKGAAVEELNWDFEGINTSPFFHREDLPQDSTRVGLNRNDNSWQIGERFFANSLKETNSILLKSLEQGASAINLDLKTVSERDVEILFAKVQHEWISTHLNLNDSVNPLQSIQVFFNVVKSKGQEASKIHGSIRLKKGDSAYWPVLKELFSTLPLFAVQINSNETQETNALDTLISILENTYSFLQSGQENGFELEELLKKLSYTIIVGDEYYAAIVLLRSVRLLVRRLCSSYCVSHIPLIRIETWLKASDQTDNVNYNLIKNTSQILGAVVGGADIVYPMAYSKTIQDEHHNHRISRNINHVLQLESYMDRVVDPAAGSYFFESMTERFCQKAWKEFQNRVED